MDYITGSLELFDRFQKWKQFDKDVDAKLRLLYLECLRNKDVLRCLDLSPKSKIPTDDKAFVSVVDCFETDVMETIFWEGKKNVELYKILKKTVDIELENDVENEPNEKPKTILNTCRFLYLKINSLKKIKDIEQGDGLKKIRYRARLLNIQKSFQSVLVALETHEIIRELKG